MTETAPTHDDRVRDLLIITGAYLLATMAALATLLTVDAGPLLDVLVADVVATVVIFGCSVVTRNSSCYDAYWSVAPPLIAAWFVSLAAAADGWRQLIVLSLVLLWSVRLTVNWAWTWRGLSHEDWRYVDLAALAGPFWWPLSLTGIHLFPTLVVFCGCLSLYPALATHAAPLNALDAIAAAITLAAIGLEFEADRQLHAFRSTRPNRAAVLDSGVWAWCRHPNYLGELGFWFGLFGFGVAAHGGIYPWTWLGPATMTALFVVVSIPMIERKLRADKPGYADYRARTFALLPLPRRRPTRA